MSKMEMDNFRSKKYWLRGLVIGFIIGILNVIQIFTLCNPLVVLIGGPESAYVKFCFILNTPTFYLLLKLPSPTTYVTITLALLIQIAVLAIVGWITGFIYGKIKK